MAKTRNFDPFNFYPSAEFSMYFFFAAAVQFLDLHLKMKILI